MVLEYRGSRRTRYREIAEVLVKHGLGYVASVVGLDRFAPFGVSLFGGLRGGELAGRPERVRMALEDLGATATKLGQILSTRPDLLPPAYQLELAKLQDQVPPVPFEAVREVLEDELGDPPEECFASFTPEALAAASIGQVHEATLRDGTEVVVKVRRPGIASQIGRDLEILHTLASAASRRWELADEYDVEGLAEEFSQTLRSELDYVREGRNAERFARNFARDERVHIPRVYWDTTTERVLTLERLRGIKITDLPALEAAGIDRAALAQRAARVLLEMVFEHGFFHADPHPGNFLVEADGRIGLLDFGMVGEVSEKTQNALVQILIAVTSGDAESLVEAFLETGVARRRVDRQALQRDLEHLLARYYGRPLGEIPIAPVIEEIFSIVRRHHLRLPSSLVMLLKTAVMAEGMGTQLDPSFNLAEILEPYARRLLVRQYSPLRWGRRLGQAGIEAIQLGTELPRQLRRIVGELERGDLEVGMRPTGMGPIMRRLEELINRLVLGMIASAFTIGLAVLSAVYHPPGWDQWAGAVFVIGFVLAGTLGLYLAISILRSGRR